MSEEEKEIIEKLKHTYFNYETYYLVETAINCIEKLQKENKELKEDSISKDIIRNFIKEELPDDEIMKYCENFDSNGVYLRKKLEELLGG